MKKTLLIAIILISAASAIYFGFFYSKEGELTPVDKTIDVMTGLDKVKLKSKAIKDLAISNAYKIYRLKLAEGADFSNGPCLSERLIDDWVLDIAHNPRKEIDNKPENQCQSFRNGEAHHFVELDPDGNLIRAE